MPKITDYYLDISDCNFKLYKIYSSKFGGLVGQDDFNKRGDIVLNMFKIIQKPFDHFYKLRGDTAEEYVNFNLKYKFQDLKWYGETAEKKNNKTYDMFNNPHFGAVLDFSYTESITKETVSLEIKSKNIKYYEKILQNGADKSHIAQAELAAYLAGFKKFNILYVFFTDEQENFIREANESVFYQEHELKYLLCKYEVDTKKIMDQMAEAWDYCSWVAMYKQIPLLDISEESFRLLGFEPPKIKINA